MSYAPQTLLDLRAYLKPLTGLSDNALGIVGDSAHTYGYHLGKDRLRSGDYSNQHARDRAGLTNAASANDVGWFARLVAMTAFVVAEAKAGRARDLREVIGPAADGRAYRWAAENNWAPQIRSRGDSHEKHGHFSWFRDSEHREKVSLFRRFFEGDDDMAAADVWGVPIGSPSLAAEIHPRWISQPASEYLKYTVEAAHNIGRVMTQVAALTAVVEQLAAVITAGGGSVDTAAILAGVDERLAANRAAVKADTRDAVADLGEGGAVQVRADA